MALKTLISLLILSFSLSSPAVTVISDLDDTIKITQVKTVWNYYNSIVGTRVFLGMDQLVRDYKDQNSQNKVIVLSGSPEVLRGAVNRLMTKNNIPADAIYLAGKPEKKMERLLSLAEEINDDLVLIGDDQEFDPSFYQEVKAKFPDKVKAIYIHQVNNRPVLPGQIGFITAYEVAVYEAQAGRLSNNNVENVRSFIEGRLNLAPQDTLVTQRVSETLVPRWSKCPAISPLQSLPGDVDFTKQIEVILNRNCKSH
ncbi:phosphatase domain-containing protein [Bdellovibrio bacteriovorus]|uniref:phosphatase domain-containing protein n=1 Tax=Bdellovibrio TaxID=958 RepID=UPI0035A93D6F